MGIGFGYYSLYEFYTIDLIVSVSEPNLMSQVCLSVTHTVLLFIYGYRTIYNYQYYLKNMCMISKHNSYNETT